MTADRIGNLERRLDQLASRANNRFTRIELVDGTGRARGTLGAQSDGTFAYVTVDDPKPCAPTAPILEPVVWGLAITWDGGFAGNCAPTADTQRVNVHVFGPGARSTMPTAASLRASFSAPGTFTINLPVGDLYTVVFQTETTGGSVSDPSEPAWEAPAPSEADTDAAEALRLAQQALDQIQALQRIVLGG